LWKSESGGGVVGGMIQAQRFFNAVTRIGLGFYFLALLWALFAGPVLMAGFLSPAFAQPSGHQIDALHFGRVVVRNNSSVHEITVETNGNFFASSGAIIFIEDPQEGRYFFDGLPEDSVVDAEVIAGHATYGSALPGAYFVIEDFTYVVPNTNGIGQVTITVGATAKTTGLNDHYVSGTYSADITVSAEVHL